MMLKPIVVLTLTAAISVSLGGVLAQTVTRGPYLQIGTPTSVVVKWRTDIASSTRVQFGFSPERLEFAVEDTNLTTEHEVRLAGLMPDTKYYYAIGPATSILTGFQTSSEFVGDSSYFFVTSPAAGKPTRIWILGDSGTKNDNARAVRDAYYNFTGVRHTDLWLMLGDNAYDSGLDEEYQAAVFDMYPEMLRKSVLWPTRGNHDRGPRDEFGDWTDGGDYYRIFTMPTAGEAGGLPSGTEAYYSFDYGAIHFICLESTSSELRRTDSPMWSWLEADLAANDKFWTIAFWHHPPYSKGSHDSDSENALIQMRERALPLLESYGVDLVLCGHSHSYERSFMLKGHYGKSSTLTETMILDGGDGRSDGDGVYSKLVTGDDPNAGAVYVVAGSSGKVSSGPLDHPVMFVSFKTLGSLALDIDGARLDATFITSTGAILDYFTIIKSGGSAARLTLVSGDQQVGLVGTALPEPFVVQAQDAGGQPLPGAAVDFTIIAGEGQLSNTQQLSDPNGFASTTLTLGDSAGVVRVAATSAGVADTVFFEAAATLPPVADISASPQQIDFGEVWVGDSLAAHFEIKNLGQEDLQITEISIAGGDALHFKMDSLSSPLILPTDSSQIMAVRFKPLSLGLKQAHVRLVSNDADENLLTIAVTGVGTTEFPQVTVQPKVTTTSTPSNADDPAIWIHPTAPSRSVIIGTDKSAGIFVWDLSGTLLQHLPQGTDVNNVDVRQNVRWGSAVADIVAANLRDAGKLAVFKVNPDYTGADVLMQLAGATSQNNNIQNDSYGFCLYKHPADSALYVFERPKSGGVVRQYRVAPDSSGEVLVAPVRDLNYSGGVAEGFVADDQLGFVYITEETHGIHKYFAAPHAAVDQIAVFGEGDGTADDREGLALYACADGGGYLVLSSQGNDTFKIFERQGNNRFLKTILPLDELGNPGLGTDGLDVTAFAAPPHFPNGFLVAHEQRDRQFHLYDWAEIAEDHLAICVIQQPQISVSPTAYEFGELAIGDSAVAAFVIKNTGAAELIVSDLSLTTSDEFHLQSAPAPVAIAPGDSSSLTVAFVPISAGVKNSILQVASNDGENPLLEIHLSGAAFEASRPQISIAPPTIDFGEVVVGDSAQAQLVIRNLGDAVLSVIEISLLAGLPAQEFQIDTLAAPVTLAPLDSILLGVAFRPITLGAKNGAVLIVSSDPQNDSLEVALSGSAITDPVSVVDEPPVLPDRIVLKPVYPNPFNAEAVIEYALPQPAAVRLVIYNLLGQPIRILVDEMETAGFKKVRWDGRDGRGVDVGSGIYYIILIGSDSLRGQAGSQRLVRKITLLK